MTTTQDYVVAGLQSERCVEVVTEEVLSVPTVREVLVHLEGGAMAVTSEEPVEFEVISAAVSDAGYTLGSR